MINLIELSTEKKVQKFINLQTSLCYGNPYKLPIPIDHYLNPKSSYAITKTAGELYLINSKLDFVSFRLASVIAPRLYVGVIPTFYKRLKDGKNCFCSDAIRDFIGINEFLDLIYLSLEKNSPKGIFNVSNGIGVSVKQIHDKIAEILKIDNIKEPPILPVNENDLKEVVLDPKETFSAFGWKANTHIQENLQQIIDWYNENQVEEVYSHNQKIEIKE